MTNPHRIALIFAAALSLSACSSRFTGAGNDAPPVDSDIQQPAEMSDSEIRKALSGKSWRWQSPKNSGVTLYAADGTSLVEVDGKGTTTGKWSIENGSLCESFSPASFMPKGMAKSCQPVSGGGNTFTIGQATFTLA